MLGVAVDIFPDGRDFAVIFDLNDPVDFFFGQFGLSWRQIILRWIWLVLEFAHFLLGTTHVDHP